MVSAFSIERPGKRMDYPPASDAGGRAVGDRGADPELDRDTYRTSHALAERFSSHDRVDETL